MSPPPSSTLFHEVSWASGDEAVTQALREAGAKTGVLLVHDMTPAPLTSVKALFDLAYSMPKVRRGGETVGNFGDIVVFPLGRRKGEVVVGPSESPT